MGTISNSLRVAPIKSNGIMTSIESPGYYDMITVAEAISRSNIIKSSCIDGLKEEIVKVLLEDPDSEVKKLAENYLIQCLYDATEDPEKNPILNEFFGRRQQDMMELMNEVRGIKAELMDLKAELGLDYYSNYSGSNGGVAWNNDVQAQFVWLEEKLNNITKKIEDTGIDKSNREN